MYNIVGLHKERLGASLARAGHLIISGENRINYNAKEGAASYPGSSNFPWQLRCIFSIHEQKTSLFHKDKIVL